MSASLYAGEKTGVIALSRVEDPLAGPVVHAGTTVLKPASALLVYGQLAIAILWALAIGTSLIYFLIWGVRRLRKKIAPGPTIRVRVWPLLAGVSAVVFVAVFAVGMADPFEKLGAPTAYSITIMLSTIAFALFAAFGVITSIRERRTAMNRVNYWHSTVSSFTHLVVALYMRGSASSA